MLMVMVRDHHQNRCGVVRRLLRLGGAEQALTNYQHAEAEVAQGELEKALKGYQEAEAPAAEAALRELEKALTNYQSAEAVSCCGPLRSCRHRKRWAAMPQT